MKFLANENFPGPSIRLLREAGIEISSIAEEFSGISDNQVIKIAQSTQSVILTFDKDYGELIFRLNIVTPPAVVFFRFKGPSPTYAGDLLLKIIKDNTLQLKGTFTVVEENNIRQRPYL